MFSLAVTVLSLAVGYVLVAGLISLSSFGLVSARPGLAVTDDRLRPAYKLLLLTLWLISCTISGYVAAAIATVASPRNAAALLAAALIVVVWRNKSEVRQMGFIFMMLVTVCIIGGVASGYLLKTKF